MHVYVEAHGLSAYPDLSVICEEEQYVEGELQDNLLNPTLLVEVLSDSGGTGVVHAAFNQKP